MTATRTLDPGAAAAPDWRRFLHPLDLICAAHESQLGCCDLLDDLAEAPEQVAESVDLIPRVIACMTDDLHLHTQDEEQGLFPLLRERCLPSDGIRDILALLTREHEVDADLAAFIVSDLEGAVGRLTRTLPMRFCINARAFAETLRRHIGWENHLVLPLARKRLTPGDLAALGRDMALRRGIDLQA